MVQVFVYGTLKPGECNYQRYCAGLVVETKSAIALGQLFSLPLGYPAMIPGNSPVHGFVLSFSTNDILHQLDWLEDYDPQRPATENEYNRQQISIYDTAINPLGTAWAYLMTWEQIQTHCGVLVPNGCWSSFTCESVRKSEG